MRKLTQPHNLIHVLMAVAGVVLLATGSAVGLFLLVCALMMGVMMAGTHDHDDSRPGTRGHH